MYIPCDKFQLEQIHPLINRSILHLRYQSGPRLSGIETSTKYGPIAVPLNAKRPQFLKSAYFIMKYHSTITNSDIFESHRHCNAVISKECTSHTLIECLSPDSPPKHCTDQVEKLTKEFSEMKNEIEAAREEVDTTRSVLTEIKEIIKN